jgi:outer membrane receptor protein involved in Fe transport
VSRPDFRELSPFDFTNVIGGFTVIGNPNLKRAKINNLDFRYEFFPTADQVMAASFFYKKFTDPIEQTIEVGQALRQTFINALGANNYGLELEFRRRLNFLSPKFREWLIQSNLTVVSSNVDISPEQQLALTSASRPLTGQSRYIMNAQVEWARPQWRSSSRFYVNSVSRRITDVGSFGVPDIYQERNLFLDFVYQFNIREDGRWGIKFSAENLADNHYRYTQGDLPFRNYRLGRTFSIGTSFSAF